ncbi:MAG: hypothetical protein HZA51_01315 [Planctomycetes bacterium]|nr:hypothetical protein [Planctomycetota bacterium]
MLTPMSREEFFDSYWGKKFCHISGARDRFCDLLPWQSVNGILEDHQLRYPQVRIAKDGESGSAATGGFLRQARTRRGEVRSQIDATALISELRNGATLILDAVDDMVESIREIAVDFESIFREPIQANAYAGWGTSKGFDLHWDDHDVLVVQIHGSKSWKVYGARREAPLYCDFHSDNTQVPSEPIWSGVLQAGDVLYLPRGWWHVAVPLGHPTLHVSFGINRRTGIDFLAWIESQMRERVEFRRDLIRIESTEQSAQLAAMRNIVTNLFQPPAVKQFLDEMCIRSLARPRIGLPWTVLPAGLPPDQYILRTTLPRPFERQIDAISEESIVIRGLAKVWRFDMACEPLLRIALDGRGHALQELLMIPIVGINDPARRDLLKTLILEGLLYIQHPGER